MTRRVLIVGARDGSLGQAIADTLGKRSDFEVHTAGQSGDEMETVDVRSPASVVAVMDKVRPHSIISTVGVNLGAPIGETGYWHSMRHSWDVNVEGPMRLLDTWIKGTFGYEKGFNQDQTFVAVSSNSAQIARRSSSAYCSSKAALSMALRCAARELGGAPLVYGYEFGLLANTPMTVETEKRFGPSQSRMVGAKDGLDKWEAASAVVANLVAPWQGLNGVMLRLDAGEQ